MYVRKGSSLQQICFLNILISCNIFQRYFLQWWKKPSHFICQFVHFLLNYLSLYELSWQGRVKLAHSYGWDNPVFFGCWITPDYSVINLARAKPSWFRSDFHQQGVWNFAGGEIVREEMRPKNATNSDIVKVPGCQSRACYRREVFLARREVLAWSGRHWASAWEGVF